jgi:hypothetical protein
MKREFEHEKRQEGTINIVCFVRESKEKDES